MQQHEQTGYSFQSLMQELKLGGKTLKNRIIFPPITTGLAAGDGSITPEMCTYYSAKAENGPAAVIVEAAAVSTGGKLSPYSPGAWSDKHIAGLSKLGEKIKEKGALAYLQLAHGGARAASLPDGETAVAPSAISLKKTSPAPRPMNGGEIEAMIEKFVKGAERAGNAGFDGVELHCAHFYLLSSFLSPVTNKREDQYGGDIARRSRIVREIISAIKSNLGQNFTVICRVNGSELHKDGIGPQDAAAISRQLEKAGADAVHVSGYNIPVEALKRFVKVPALAVPRKDDLPGVFVPSAEIIKKQVGVPVICVGKINIGGQAEEIVSSGKSDLVAVGRPLLADPQFWRKQLEGGKINECRYCLYCLKSIRKGRIACRVNKNLF